MERNSTYTLSKNNTMEEKTFIKEVEIKISSQALKILSGTKYSVEEFEEWALKDQKISLGGHNVTVFLEEMYNRENINEVN